MPEWEPPSPLPSLGDCNVVRLGRTLIQPGFKPMGPVLNSDTLTNKPNLLFARALCLTEDMTTPRCGRGEASYCRREGEYSQRQEGEYSQRQQEGSRVRRESSKLNMTNRMKLAIERAG